MCFVSKNDFRCKRIICLTSTLILVHYRGGFVSVLVIEVLKLRLIVSCFSRTPDVPRMCLELKDENLIKPLKGKQIFIGMTTEYLCSLLYHSLYSFWLIC